MAVVAMRTSRRAAGSEPQLALNREPIAEAFARERGQPEVCCLLHCIRLELMLWTAPTIGT